MNYRYIGRNPNGEKVSGIIRANDRESVLAILKSEGIIPVSVKSAADTPERLFPPKIVIWGILILVFIVLGFALFHGKHETERIKSPTKEKIAKQSSEKRVQRSAEKSTPPKRKPQKKSEVPAAISGFKISDPIIKPSGQTEDDYAKERAERSAWEEATRPYRSKTEVYISMLGKPGDLMPPLPLMDNEDLEQDFETAITNVITIWEDDTEEQMKHKEMVAWIKEHLAEARAEGWKVSDFLRELEAYRREQAQMKMEAEQLLEQEREARNGDVEGLREQLNKELGEEGIVPIPWEEE